MGIGSKLILFFILIVFNSDFSYSQRILFQSDFENITLTIPDSLPTGWAKLDVDSNFFGLGKSWAVRDTTHIAGGDTIANRPRAHSGKKSLHISWFSGKGGSYEGDDWAWTDSLRIIPEDSLIFWALLGNTQGISFYVDSLQIWICSEQNPNAVISHLATLKSNLDTVPNIWKERRFDLSQFAGQRIYVAFRYYLPVQNALWCNIDDMFIGNRSYTSTVNQNGTNIPASFFLSQNYPNPFNPKTVIKYDISFENKGLQPLVQLRIYNALGKEVEILVNERQPSGDYTVEWDASNYPSGTYFYNIEIHPDRLQAESFSETKQMTLLK